MRGCRRRSHDPDDDVGELSFVGSPSGSFGLVLCHSPGHVCLGFGVAAGLGDVDDVQHGVDSAVAAEVEAVVPRGPVALAGGHCDRRDAAPAGEPCFGLEPAGVADLGEKCHCGDDADPVDVGQRAAECLQERRDLRVQILDARADADDVGPAGSESVQLEAITGRQACVTRLKFCQPLQRREYPARSRQLLTQSKRQRDQHRLGLSQQPDTLQDVRSAVADAALRMHFGVIRTADNRCR